MSTVPASLTLVPPLSAVFEWHTNGGMDDDVIRAAALSHDGRYRYSLVRSWAPWPPSPNRPLEFLPWVLLNPSTADHEVDDQTVRQVMHFSRREGYHGCVIVNLFALRSSDPVVLAVDPDPAGPWNDWFLEQALAGKRTAVAAWGAHRMGVGPGAVLAARHRGLFRCLGRTASGAPRHPARLGHSVPLEAF